MYRSHVSSQHLKTHSKPYACQSCVKRFALRADLHRHIKSRHRVGQSRFECRFEGCTFAASRKDNLTQHRKLHGAKQQKERSPKSSPDVVLSEIPPHSSLAQTKEELATPTNSSSFMQAASAGCIVFLAHALRAGIDVNVKSPDGFTALHCAARADQVDTLHYLLSRGADHNCLSGKDAESKRTQAIHQAVEGNSPACFEILIRQEPQTALASELNFRNLLCCVARSENNNLVDILVKHRIADWYMDDWPSILAREAAKAGQKSLIELLLSDRRLSLLPTAKQPAQHSPLYQAAKNGHVAVVRSLLAARQFRDDQSKEFMNVKSRALRRAAKKGHAKVVTALLKSEGKAELLGRRALQHTAANGHVKAVELLVRSPLVDVNYASSGGDTALHLAARSGHLPVVQLLTSQEGVNPFPKNTHGETPLLAAFWHSQLDIVRFLSQYDPTFDLQGIDFVKDSISQMTKRLLAGDVLSVNAWGSRKSLLHLAAGLGDVELLETILDHEDFNLDLATLNATDYDGATPLEIASAKGSTAIVDLLVAHGATNAAVETDQRPQQDGRQVNNRRAQSYNDSESDEDSETED